MSFYEVYEKVNKVLEGHRKGHYDIQMTVDLLKRVYSSAAEADRDSIIQTLWGALVNDPPIGPTGNRGPVSPNLHAVVIRAIAEFGPTAELPFRVFAFLVRPEPAAKEYWAQEICPALAYSMLHNEDRFVQATLEQAKGLCSTYTYLKASGLTNFAVPKSVVDAASNLERVIDHIEYSRFAASLTKIERIDYVRAAVTLVKGVDEASTQGDELTELLRALNPAGSVYRAIQKAEEYLQGSGEFDAKNAGGLIRGVMEETHRELVPRLAAMKGLVFNYEDKDGDRRRWLREIEFISPSEEEFFSAIYRLISREASHKLIAPRETMALMHHTVRGYLLLLLRRLRERKETLPPPAP